MSTRSSSTHSIIERLKTSKFRSAFKLGQKELEYLTRKGWDQITKEAFEFIRSRIAPAYPTNDGRQTPMRNHPVFVAQHATATCCRKCLEKWYRLEQGRALSPEEVNFVVEMIIAWLRQNVQL